MKRRFTLSAIACAALLLTAQVYFHAEVSAAAPAAVASAPEGAAAHEPVSASEASAPTGAHGESAGHETGAPAHEGGEHEGSHVDYISFFGLFSLRAEIWTAINLALLLITLTYFLYGGSKKFF